MKKGSSRKEWILQHGQDDDIIPDSEYNNIISETPITKQSQKLLATIRLPQDDGSCHRTKVKFRAVEGQHGELCVYVVGRTGTEKNDLSSVCLKFMFAFREWACPQ